MARLTTVELQNLAREHFGRELSEQQAEAYRGRLPTMVRNVQTLEQWARRLQAVDPALVQRVTPGDADG
jgi:hypothetical protein